MSIVLCLHYSIADGRKKFKKSLGCKRLSDSKYRELVLKKYVLQHKKVVEKFGGNVKSA